MLMRENEKAKVNNGELSVYEKLLKKEELIEEEIIRDFDGDMKKVLGSTLYNYLKKNNYITPNFLINFHYTDIPMEDVFAYEDGSYISVRDYYRSKVREYFKDHTDRIKKDMKPLDLSEKVLDDKTPYTFALASLALTTFHRKKGIYVRDVQKLAGFGMCYGEVAELATGEGKTISAVLPAYFHALRGKGVHVVTANSYLSKRDYTELLPVYEGLGLSCGYVESDEDIKDNKLLKKSKKMAYNCDITYSSKDEIAFDYLRDSTAKDIEDVVTRNEKPGYAIIDEIDDALVDSANNPYIIAGLPSVYQDGMKIDNLCDAMSLPLDFVTKELALRGIKISEDRELTRDEASKVAELFSKNIYDDIHEPLNIAQAYYLYLKRTPVVIEEKDKQILEKYKNIISIENGITKVSDVRLYNLLIGDTQNLKDYSYYGKYGFDPNEIASLRKYTKIVVCPTSSAFYVTSDAFEDYLNLQFLSSKSTIRQMNKDSEKIFKYLERSCYTITTKGEVRLNNEGIRKIARSGKLVSLFPELCSSYDKLINNKNELGSYYNHLLTECLTANELLTLGEDYTISNGEIVLLKNAREQIGSKYSEGLEQAIEIKELYNGKVKQSHENPTLASITQKEFYARYDLFSGMTGTSAKRIFDERYGKKTLEVPRDAYYRHYSKRLNREGRASKVEPLGIDRKRPVFAKDNKDKYELVYESIKESGTKNPKEPVLIVVSDPNELEGLEKFLLSKGIDLNVLESSRLGEEDRQGMESVKVAKAGRVGAVTLATMMAGRGTDIKLGGDRDTIIEFATDKAMREKHIPEIKRDEVRALCEESLMKQGLIPSKEKEEKDRKDLERIGLKVISVGFFNSQRLDRQLEGRTGRNGISGTTEKYSSPEDLIHLGLERVHGEPILDLFARATKYGDGSVDLKKHDFYRLTNTIRTLQEANDTSISESIKFAQDMSTIASNKMELVRLSRRNLLELTRNERSILSNREYILDETYKMLTLTVDNLLVSYMENNRFIDNPNLLIDGNIKEKLGIDYEGLKLACKEILGLDMNVDTFKNSDISVLEFREALINYTKNMHDSMLKANPLGILKRDVKVLLHKDDDNISRIHEELEQNKKQKTLDYMSNSEKADSYATISMGVKIRDLECSSAKAGTRLLLGRILRKEEKQELERHRKALFDYRIDKKGTSMPLSKEDDSTGIGLLEKYASKQMEKAVVEREETDKELLRKMKKKALNLTPQMYDNLRIRPVAFMMSVDGKFTLVKEGPTIVDLLDSQKTI